jgi:hypothetical protein
MDAVQIIYKILIIINLSLVFKMLKYKSGGLFMGIVKTVRTVNPLGSNPNGYRYALF